MLRKSLIAVSLVLTACGIDPAIPAVQESQLVAAQPAPAPTMERLEVSVVNPTLRANTQLVPLMDTVTVHSLDAADGTQVRYVLGMMGCGISVVAQGTATVQDGAFVIPYDQELTGFGEVSLFFQLDQAACDPETTQIYEATVALPGTLDLSTLPAESFAGCWLFE